MAYRLLPFTFVSVLAIAHSKRQCPSIRAHGPLQSPVTRKHLPDVRMRDAKLLGNFRRSDTRFEG
jgi:hypothetical protein